MWGRSTNQYIYHHLQRWLCHHQSLIGLQNDLDCPPRSLRNHYQGTTCSYVKIDAHLQNKFETVPIFSWPLIVSSNFRNLFQIRKSIRIISNMTISANVFKHHAVNANKKNREFWNFFFSGKDLILPCEFVSFHDQSAVFQTLFCHCKNVI